MVLLRSYDPFLMTLAKEIEYANWFKATRPTLEPQRSPSPEVKWYTVQRSGMLQKSGFQEVLLKGYALGVGWKEAQSWTNSAYSHGTGIEFGFNILG